MLVCVVEVKESKVVKLCCMQDACTCTKCCGG